MRCQEKIEISRKCKDFKENVRFQEQGEISRKSENFKKKLRFHEKDEMSRNKNEMSRKSRDFNQVFREDPCARGFLSYPRCNEG